MGMSASQAKLLSITGRLTDNELRSQFISNSKLRLAAESTKASNEYLNALNSQILMYKTYDDNGEMTQTPLTSQLLYEYEPLKNQYILLNTSNQMLVGHTEAVNYEETNTLSEFLERYNLIEYVKTEETVQKTKMEPEEVPNPEYDKYIEEHPEPKIEDEKYIIHHVDPPTTRTVNKWHHTDSLAYDALTETNIRNCFDNVLYNNSTTCQYHVLAALIGVGTHTTSDGHEFEVIYCPNNEFGGLHWDWNTYSTDEEIDNTIREQLKTDPVHDQPYDNLLLTEEHGEVYCKGDGSDAAKYNQPLVINPDGTRTGGYCYQKAIDLLYHNAINQSQSYYDEYMKSFWYFIEFDLGQGELKQEEETIPGREWDEVDFGQYEDDHDKWEKNKPPKTKMEDKEVFYDETITTEYSYVNDKDKAQWYTNIWYKMNGSQTANMVREINEKDDYPEELQHKSIFYVLGSEKNIDIDTKYYKELDSNLCSSEEWLQFALEHCVVTLEQAKFYNPAEDNDKVPEYTADAYTWDPIPYKNATDIVSVEDKNKIAVAQVKYKKDMNDIQAKDKKYDQDLKKLDTEHNALQTEYDSVKEMLSKNVDRSFKAFS